MAALTISYSGKNPVISYPMYVVETPLGYNIWWATTPIGPWYRANVDPVLLLFYEDSAHPLTTERRIFWKVTVMTNAGEIDHAGPAAYEQIIRQPFIDRILREIQRRHALMLNGFSGEQCSIYLRKAAGETCSCVAYAGDGGRIDTTLSLCPECYGVGISGGYVKLSDVQIRLRSSQEAVELVPGGFKQSDSRSAWVGAYPLFDVGDFFERANGERFSVQNVRRRETQGLLTFQMLTIQQVEPQHPLYRVAL